MAAYETASRLEPRAIPPLVNASLVLNRLGQNDQAEKCLRKALSIEPTSLAANLNLGMLLGELGRPREAEDAFRAALKADPTCAQPAYNVAVLVAERDVHEAVNLCRTACRLQPREPKYALALAIYLHRAGDADQAIHTLYDLIKDCPGCADGYSLLGRLLTQHGRIDEATEVFRHAANNKALSPAARRHFEARARELGSQ